MLLPDSDRTEAEEAERLRLRLEHGPTTRGARRATHAQRRRLVRALWRSGAAVLFFGVAGIFVQFGRMFRFSEMMIAAICVLCALGLYCVFGSRRDPAAPFRPRRTGERRAIPPGIVDASTPDADVPQPLAAENGVAPQRSREHARRWRATLRGKLAIEIVIAFVATGVSVLIFGAGLYALGFEGAGVLVVASGFVLLLVGGVLVLRSQPYRKGGWRFRRAISDKPRRVGQRTRAQQQRLTRALWLGAQLVFMLLICGGLLLTGNPGLAIFATGVALSLFLGAMLGFSRSRPVRGRGRVPRLDRPQTESPPESGDLQQRSE